jgi:acyl-CoA thioesterase I
MNTTISRILVSIVTMALVACGGGGGSDGDSQTPLEIIKPKTPVVILIYGDSISQGYGKSAYGIVYQQISPGNTYAELLQLRIKNEKIDEFASVSVINDSLGSEFTDDALARLPTTLAHHHPTHIVLAHGTNDAGAATSLEPMKNNLISMTNIAKMAGVKVLLADITPARRGTEFAATYSKAFKDVANLLAVTYVPLLNGIFGNSKYYLPDFIHPNDEAQNFMLNNLWLQLMPTLK